MSSKTPVEIAGRAPISRSTSDSKHKPGTSIDFGSAWTYAPAPEATDHVRIQPRYELFIGGKWRAPSSKKYFDTISPSTEEKLAEVAEGDDKDVDLAVRAARVAYDKY